MQKGKSALLLGAALLTILLATSASHTFQSNVAFADSEQESIAEHGALTLTIYQGQDLALIQDDRVLEMTQGVYEMPVRGLPSQLIPESVQLAALESPDALLIEEQRFETDPENVWAILSRHFGEEIEVYASGADEPYRGVLVSLSGGVLLRDEKNQMHLIQDATRFSFPADELHGPMLIWRVQSGQEGPVPVSIKYLSSGLNWWANYSLVLDESGQSIDLKSWVSVSNRTDLDLHQPALNLISGMINRSQESPRDFAETAAAPSASKQASVSQQPVFEYHEYSLPRPALLASGQTSQIAFIDMASIPISKNYIFEAYRYSGVQVWISFVNPKDENRPLPAGLVRMYQDSASGQRFIGEDAVGHVPVGEEVRLLTGLAFDLVAKRTPLSHSQSADYVYQDRVQIELTNRKSEAVTIQARDAFSGDWKILESNYEYEKLDASTAEFKVTLAPDETKTIEYLVEYHY